LFVARFFFTVVVDVVNMKQTEEEEAAFLLLLRYLDSDFDFLPFKMQCDVPFVSAAASERKREGERAFIYGTIA
jgi:hypothetical protein